MVHQNQFYVMAMAYGNEPRRLLATVRDGALFVSQGSHSEWLPYPEQFVFEEDAGLFERLQKAFNGGNGKRLAALWREARQMKLPAEAGA
jgi:hypothetical protein